MKRLFLSLIAIILFFCGTAFSRAKYSGYVEQGGKSVKTSSVSTYYLMETFPASTVTVYLAGTTTLASLYTNTSGTVKANPFTADSHSYFEFYADNGFYDIKFSGTGIITPWTRSYIALSDPNDDYNPKSFGAKCDNSTNDTSAFSAILSFIGSNNSTIKIPKLPVCRINDITFPANTILDFSFGGGLYANTTKVITMNGDMIGPNHTQRFYNGLASQGTFNFSNNFIIEDYHTLWWGSTCGAVLAAVNNGNGIIHLSTYDSCDRIRITKRGTHLTGSGGHLGAGSKQTTLQFNSQASETTQNSADGIFVDDADGIILENFYMESTAAITGGSAIHFSNVTQGDIRNISATWYRGATGKAIQIGDSDFSISITAATNASPVVFTATGHNLYTGKIVAIIGGTGSWTAINGDQTVTVIDSNHFSIPINSTAFGALTGTITAIGSGANAGVAVKVSNTIVGTNGGTGFYLGVGSTSSSFISSYSIGSLNGYHIYKATYSGIDRGAADSGTWGYITESSTGINLTNCGAENNSKSRHVITGGSTAIVDLNGRGAGNNSSGDTTIGSYVWIPNFGINYGIMIIGGIDTSPNAATVYNIRGDAGNLWTHIFGQNSANFTLGVGGNSTWINNFVSCSNCETNIAPQQKVTFLLVQGEGAALVISANAVTPTNNIHQIGAGLLKTINVPDGFSGTIALVPTAAFTYDATGNILGTGTATIGRTMYATYSTSTSKWSMSY